MINHVGKNRTFQLTNVYYNYIIVIYSETVKYALLALAYLAVNRDRLVKVEEIAEAQRIPKPFLSKIFHKLARERVLKSYKGPTGGFTLAVPPDKITIMDVIKYPLGPEGVKNGTSYPVQCMTNGPSLDKRFWNTLAQPP